jgi:outer membrane protein TolC
MAGALTVPLVLSLPSPAQAPGTFLTEPNSVPAVAAKTIPLLSLMDCLHLALDHQPTLAASRASLAAAEAQLHGLNRLRVPPILAGRELPIRRKQAALGVTIASAGLTQVEYDSAYAVKRTYYTVQFARQQHHLAASVVEDLKGKLEGILPLVGKSRYITESDANRIRAYLEMANARQDEAAIGIQRATASLREAMGVGPDYCFDVAAEPWTKPEDRFCREELIALALSRRGEMTQAASAAQLTGLEIDAQAASCWLTARTFASGSDVHARAIPQETRNNEYRPGAIGLEMPPSFVGPRADRVERAEALNARAYAVVEKTRNLIALEAEDAYLKWDEAHRKVKQTSAAADYAEKTLKDLRDRWQENQNPTFLEKLPAATKEYLEALVRFSQIRSEYNQALFQLLLSIAGLERVTAGGVCDTSASLKPSQP